MPANSVNYIVLFKNDSQVYGSSSKKVAVESPTPVGVPLEDKVILYITHQPDEERISVVKLPDEDVHKPEVIKYKKNDPRYIEPTDGDEDE